MNEEMTVRKYCDKMDITIAEFGRICNLSPATIERIKDDRGANLTLKTIKKIEEGTKTRFGKALEWIEYLD
jgi:transcriptional regulator with XRE-family HTH domain